MMKTRASVKTDVISACRCPARLHPPFPQTLGLYVAALLTLVPGAVHASPTESTYRGWKTWQLKNEFIEVQVAPQLGGRVIQFKLGDFEYLWVNDKLAGKSPTETGLGPKGEWINYGGAKLWPAPQGWDGDHQWPGPPDAVLDGSPFTVLNAGQSTGSLQMQSQKDMRSGIQFGNEVAVTAGSTRVSMNLKMTNIDTKKRRWGIWQVTQLNAAEKNGTDYNPQIFCYCPANPASMYPRGYNELFGLVNNLSFWRDTQNGLIVANYKRIVGKIGIDSQAGWSAVVDGKNGYAFVTRFQPFPGKEYPDGASMEYWMNGAGQIVADKKIATLSEDPLKNPHFLGERSAQSVCRT